MHLDLATLALLGALQALLLAPLLLVATRAYTGRARASLRIWGMVLLLQALGWMLAALRGQASDWLSIVLANACLIASYAGTVRAIRLLLRAPPRPGRLAAIGVVACLGIIWFSQVQPDYRMRVYVIGAMAGACMSMLWWPLRPALRRGGSNAQRVMLLVMAATVACWLPRLYELLGDNVSEPGLLLPSPGNVVNLVYSAVEPVLASIAFLLMYNEAAQTGLRRLARTDPLTGMPNRLALEERAQRLFQRAAEATPGHAVVMLDVDHFKAVNDRYGHAGGDRALATLATSLAARLRPGDLLGRIGGEEFLVLLPDTDLMAASALAEGLRAQVAALPLRLDGMPQALTVSVGVTLHDPHDADAEVAIRRADRALYAAKRAGRNRVVALLASETAPAAATAV